MCASLLVVPLMCVCCLVEYETRELSIERLCEALGQMKSPLTQDPRERSSLSRC